MAERYTIKMITPDTKDWTCKVQVVDKSRPRDNKDKTTKYQVLILQDEEENQVQATIYSTDITYFEREFAPFNTYLVSVAHVKVPPLGYENSLNKFIWTLDKNTIVEPVEEVKPPEDPLPPPRRLALTTFDTFEYQPKEFEFDVLAIVINGSPSTRTTTGKRIQEFIIMDKLKKPTKLTLWEDFIDHEGLKLFNQLHDYPIILARKIGKSSSGTSNRFVGLTSKFNTTIQINPPYPQAAELRTWIKTIETKLVSYKMKSTTPIGSIMLIPFEDEVISVANIQAQPPGQVFNVEAELSLARKYTAQIVTDPHILFPDVNLKLLLRTTVVLQQLLFQMKLQRKCCASLQKKFMKFASSSWNTFCYDSRKNQFWHSFAAATVCCVLHAFDLTMWMPYVPVFLQKLKIVSPIIAGDFDQR
ncbi:hypothetical protein KY290_015156 [Solanum tuberosum]|uniref:Uncharacterized protein n=1 Tax=Solanum tuberosum TaxID=4113 RepID=A0ABQ7VRS5_SOLTU|nr:hypothetical protein KY284_014511 [Solanum tuberosum]KAH0718517.1 hypothetical protein KY285_014548 [Solanum tuberosum]KAH0771175.1 hypothetical protein KY290_015156 [Solanum tuberosum]